MSTSENNNQKKKNVRKPPTRDQKDRKNQKAREKRAAKNDAAPAQQIATRVRKNKTQQARRAAEKARRAAVPQQPDAMMPNTVEVYASWENFYRNVFGAEFSDGHPPWIQFQPEGGSIVCFPVRHDIMNPSEGPFRFDSPEQLRRFFPMEANTIRIKLETRPTDAMAAAPVPAIRALQHNARPNGGPGNDADPLQTKPSARRSYSMSMSTGTVNNDNDTVQLASQGHPIRRTFQSSHCIAPETVSSTANSISNTFNHGVQSSNSLSWSPINPAGRVTRGSSRCQRLATRSSRRPGLRDA